jgi:hypothetical protein
MRYLLYTTLAYGGQGISYYIYCCPNHTGGIALPDGTPTPLYHALKPLNREFVAVAAELQSLQSLAVYHAGMDVPGSVPLPAKGVFRLDPPVAPLSYRPPERVRGILVGVFGPAGTRRGQPKPTHALMVNLDYRTNVVVGMPGRLEGFRPATARWERLGGRRATFSLEPGGGQLVRVR